MQKKIIRTEQELKRLMAVIHDKAAQSETGREYVSGGFYVTDELYAEIPVTGKAPEVESADRACYNGANTIVLHDISWYADYRDFQREPHPLSFQDSSSFRCIKVGGMLLLYYSGYYDTLKTRELQWFNEPDIVRKWRSRVSLDIGKAPNKVGTLTPQKLKAWVDYYKTFLTKCEEVEREVQGSIDEFRSKLRVICPEKAHLNAGAVEKDGVRFSWNIRADGYISTQTQMPQTIDAFMRFLKK